MNIVDKVEELTVFKTSDGKFHETMDAACDHQEKIYFREWCRNNICVGGEWSSDMVSDAILNNWKVEER